MSLLTNKKFYLNIGVAVVLFILIMLFVLMSLKWWTRHGESTPLPDFVGLHIEDLEQFAKQNHLNYMITDSVYNDTLSKGMIVLQDPYPGSGVKKGRTIYVTVVSSLPESVVVPNVVNLSVRQAVSLIYSNDLTINKIDFVSGFDKNAVQKQLVDGVAVEPGTKLNKYTAVTLVVSKGDHSTSNKVPNLKGLTKREAMQRLQQNSFNVGNIIGDNEKNNRLIVISQIPAPGNSSYPLGYKVSFRLSDGKQNPDDALDSLQWNNIRLEKIYEDDPFENTFDNDENDESDEI